MAWYIRLLLMINCLFYRFIFSISYCKSNVSHSKLLICSVERERERKKMVKRLSVRLTIDMDDFHWQHQVTRVFFLFWLSSLSWILFSFIIYFEFGSSFRSARTCQTCSVLGFDNLFDKSNAIEFTSILFGWREAIIIHNNHQSEWANYIWDKKKETKNSLASVKMVEKQPHLINVCHT